jgi:hypothetical protein
MGYHPETSFSTFGHTLMISSENDVKGLNHVEMISAKQNWILSESISVLRQK